VSVAHRPDISAGADRIIELAKTVKSDRPWVATPAIAHAWSAVAWPECSEFKC